MNGPVCIRSNLGVRHIQRVTEHVKQMTLHAIAHRHRDGCAGVNHGLAAHQPVGLLQRNSAHKGVAEVLGGLEGDSTGATVEGEFGGQRVINIRYLAGGELNVDHGANHAGNTARCALSRC